MEFNKVKNIKGEVTIPGDKSISHRAVMIGSIASGTTQVNNFLQGADCLATIDCFQKMGIEIINNTTTVTIKGKGLHGLTKPASILDVGNSGTTTRLISGILVAQDFDVKLNGDASIQTRPMRRIIEPLCLMGANIKSVNGDGCAPLEISGSPLKAISYQSKVASAQVKSSILLAGLYADGFTSVTEPYLSRNHSELMLKAYGANVTSNNTTATITPVEELFAQKIDVPGDISSAAYFIVAGLIVPNSEILIKNVGINPTRDGIIRVCQAMGAHIEIMNQKQSGGETTADIFVKSSNLKGITIGDEIIPTLIDEIPVIAVLACFAEGQTIIKDAAELKVKESNRIDTVVNNLKNMGADITSTEDGMIIQGGKSLKGAVIESLLDHRIAMSFAIASLVSEGTTTINDAECVNISYPQFYNDLNRLSK